ncbi:DNA-binding transcriptional regulator, LysR family [Rhizobiales bacterium GAS191]|jgi:DNA-binding transcriptional LysR family regulator|nr:DNA-binding transcriptional regulator, LysR family [Rhizobiales bacterium GAS113]SED54083.1 DNA-binding transcriptional regulator, LysR family [Rhizobiales bacterium GAS188]SEE89915.1 DNA-binding transcriptional regulator, LysR family [Rhizobiales bacterium GAS191]
MTDTIDPLLLRTFAEVARSRSFTKAATQLGLSQSTVSQQIRKLEDLVGRRVLARDTHKVALTADGEAFLLLSRNILDAHDQVRRYLEGTEVRGKLRFGASEDFVQGRLSDILRDFIRKHPSVELELTVSFSKLLNDELEQGGFDLVLIKRMPGEERGVFVRRDQLVWLGSDATIDYRDQPVPLVVFPQPSLTRSIAIDSLTAAGRPWRIACSCASLSGLLAAARAGLGVMVQPRSLVQPGLRELPATRHLPELPEVEFALAGPGVTREPGRTLAAEILRAGF